MHTLRYLPWIVALFFLGQLSAQPGKIQKDWKKLVAEADYLMERGSYHSAAEYYKEAQSINTDDLGLKLKEAEAHRMGRDYRKAATAYNSIRRKITRGSVEAGDYPLIHYHYGMMEKQGGDYEEAEEALYEFITTVDTSQVDALYYYKAKAAYEGIQLSRMETEPAVVVLKMEVLRKKVNSNHTESSAFVMPDGRLLFSSLKANEVITMEGQQEVSRLYVAEVGDEFKVGNVEKLGLALPGGLHHLGSACVSPDGRTMYLTLCEQTTEGLQGCQIYRSTKNGDHEKYDWSRPEKLDAQVNVPDYSSSTPFAQQLSDGSEVLYFSSDRPGGYGGRDLWVAKGSNGVFSEVLNLGAGINTFGDEISPFVDDAEGYEDPRPILYFSSDGHPSLGGLDVCRAFRNGTGFTDWAKVENAGKALNSSADDYSFVLSPDKSRAYLVSNRVGGYSVAGRTCCDDIFAAQLKDAQKLNLIIADLEGRVLDENKKNMENAELQLWDITGGKESMVTKTTTGAGGYGVDKIPLEREYALVVVVEGYHVQEYLFNTIDLKENTTFKKDFYLKRSSPNTPEVPSTEVCELQGKVYGVGNIGQQSPLPAAKVEIFQTIGGKEELFQALETDSRGQFQASLPVGGLYRIAVSKEGYLNASASESTRKATGECEKQISMKLQEKKQNVAFQLENILYDYDSANLRNESIPTLEKLLRLLNDNPDIIIELGSHTDSKGSDSYNQTLSQARAQSVVDWLISRGIPTSRLQAKGYGETQPIAPNTKEDGSDNPEGRQLNRRTEFKIIGGL